jgi:hypothetical protein
MIPLYFRNVKRILVVSALLFITAIEVFAQQSVARQWSETQLNCIRKYFAKPTVHARHLAHVSVAMYDAWAVYDDEAQPYFLGQTWGEFNCPFNGIPMPADGDLLAAQEKAISYAAYRTLWNRYTIFAPGANLLTIQSYINGQMELLGYDPSITSVDYSDGDPAKLGNYIAAKLQEFALQDGSNQLFNYANLQYTPVNGQLQPAIPGNPYVVDPNRWQPLVLAQCIDQNGIPTECPPGTGTPALSHEWGNVIPFALTNNQADTLVRNGLNWKVYLDPGAPPYLDTTVQTGLDESFFKWGYVMNIIWHSFHNNDDGVMVDASPNNIGGLNITDAAQLPSTFEDFQTFYNLFEGGVNDPGHTINPYTGQPYEQQLVPRKDFTRVLSQYWADGPNSETPPGHWFKLFNQVADKMDTLNIAKKWMGAGDTITNLEWDIKGYFALGGGIHDAAIACWSAKGYYDYTRPIMAIRYMGSKGQSSDPNLPHYHPAGLPLIPGYIELVYEGDSLVGDTLQHLHKIKVYSWKGPLAGTGQDGAGWLLAENWWTYQTAGFVTPPFAGYYSGHSTYSRTGAEIMTLITGDEYFPGGISEFIATQDSYLLADSGPSTTVKLQWATYRDASDQCSVSRIYGGLHPPQDDIPGRRVGLIVGPQAVNKANSCIQANPPVADITFTSNLISDQQVASNWSVDVMFDKAMDTSVNPSLIFLNSAAESSLTFESGNWLDAHIYRASYIVNDLNTVVNNCVISVQQALDSDGIRNVPSVSSNFSIDTANPAAIANVVGANNVLNQLSAIQQAEVDVFIQFNEPMNQTIDPVITLVGADENSGLTLNSMSAWTGPTTYHAVFDFEDTDFEIMDADMEISAAQDIAGYTQFITMLNNVISIDTKAPQGIVARNIEVVSDIYVGDTLIINVTCDSPMNTNGSPILAFNGLTLANNFSALGGEWQNDSTYQFRYIVLDGNINGNFSVIIAGSTDENGNILSTAGNGDTIQIDTENPEITSATPSLAIISDDDVSGSFSISIAFNEPMDTLIIPELIYSTDNPLSASMTQDEEASQWIDQTTFEAVYILSDAGEELNSIDLDVSNTFDIHGNEQIAAFSATNLFEIDTRNPMITAITPSMSVIQSDDIGEAMFGIAISFDEIMSSDSEPEIVFTSTPMINLPLNAQSQWTSADTYSAIFDVPGDIEQIASVDLTVGGNTRDAAGNLIESFNLADAFSVDIVINLNSERNEENVLTLFPNPISNGNSITIVSGAENMTQVEIIDMLGKIVVSASFQPASSKTMVLSNCSAGLYTARVTTERAVLTQPIMILH